MALFGCKYGKEVMRGLAERLDRPALCALSFSVQRRFLEELPFDKMVPLAAKEGFLCQYESFTRTRITGQEEWLLRTAEHAHALIKRPASPWEQTLLATPQIPNQQAETLIDKLRSGRRFQVPSTSVMAIPKRSAPSPLAEPPCKRQRVEQDETSSVTCFALPSLQGKENKRAREMLLHNGAILQHSTSKSRSTPPSQTSTTPQEMDRESIDAIDDLLSSLESPSNVLESTIRKGLECIFPSEDRLLDLSLTQILQAELTEEKLRLFVPLVLKQELSHHHMVAFCTKILSLRLQKLSRSASRILLGTILPCATSSPKAILDGLVLPCLESLDGEIGQLNKFQVEALLQILGVVVKQEPPLMLGFLQVFLSPDSKHFWNESTVILLAAIWKMKIGAEHLFLPLLDRLSLHAPSLASSLRFTSFLSSLLAAHHTTLNDPEILSKLNSIISHCNPRTQKALRTKLKI